MGDLIFGETIQAPSSDPATNLVVNYPEGMGPSDVQFGSNFGSPLPKLIEKSQIYKDAYELFSSDKKYGQPYLFELKAIPGSYEMRSRNVLDDIRDGLGGTSGYTQQYIDLFNEAMNEIRLLAQKYNAFIAGLPVSQDEQLKDAGFNSSITGEGLSPSSPESVTPLDRTPSSEYTRENVEAISTGISNFLSFIDSFSSVASAAVAGFVALGGLDVSKQGLEIDRSKVGLDAQRVGMEKEQSYREQESHDLNLIKQGVSPTSPNSVLAGSQQSVLKDYSSDAIYRQRLATLGSQADISAVYRNTYDIHGNPRASGLEVFNRMSQFKLQMLYGKMAEDAIMQAYNTEFAQISGALDREYMISAYGAGISENEYTMNFNMARSPRAEGSSYSTIQTQLVNLNRLDIALKAHQDYMNNLKELHILDWQDQIEDDPSVLPFYYKAALDFDMTDTFHNQDPLHQDVYYGLDVLNKTTGLIESISRSYDNFSSDEDKKQRKADRDNKRLSIRQKMAVARAAMLILK